MTTQHIDVDSPEYADAPEPLRKAYKALRKEHEDAIKERDTFRTQVQSQAVGNVLADKGFKNPKRVERDLLADGIDPLNAAAVETWLSENSDDYAKGDATPPPATPEQSAQQQNLQAIQSVAADSTTADAMNALQRALSELPANPTGAQVLAAYAKHGV